MSKNQRGRDGLDPEEEIILKATFFTCMQLR